MLRFLMGVIAIAVLVCGGTPFAYGQKATEMFIPLGQSPGLSNTVTVIGSIKTINAQKRTIDVAGPSRTWNVQITDRTKIWLDKSKLQLANQDGTFADLRKGQLVEVKYEGKERKDKGPAEWIKIQVSEPSARLDEARQ